MKAFCLFNVVLGASLIFTLATAEGGDPGNYIRDGYNECRDCHELIEIDGWDKQPFVADTWLESSHANSWSENNGNTYCMKCHAPWQADPNATHDANTPVPLEQSEAITCGTCHILSDITAEAVGTETGNFIVGSGNTPNSVDPSINGEWVPRLKGEMNDLCEYCHSGSRHAKYVMTPMAQAGVQCIDCHMPKMPIARTIQEEDPPGSGQWTVTGFTGEFQMNRSHNFDWPYEDPNAFVEKAYFACGTEGIGCHADESTEWAMSVITSGAIHKVSNPVDDLLAFAYTAWDNGTLQGVGSDPLEVWLSLATLEYYLSSAQDAVNNGEPVEALLWLYYAYLGVDGAAQPLADFATGDAVPVLADMIYEAFVDILTNL